MPLLTRWWTCVCLCLAGFVLSPCALDAKTIAGGNHFTLVAKPDGTVWAWGMNTQGQLGDGTQTDQWRPVRVTGLTDVVAVSGGMDFSLALKSDGTVWAWGGNAYGQLGDGTTTRQPAPVMLPLTNIVAIDAGNEFGMALQTGGTVWVWGRNQYGQLGNGSTTNTSTPTAISAFGTVTAISAGGYHSLVVRTDGTVWSAGFNDYGQLGDTSTTSRSTPVQMSGISTATTVSGGNEFSLVLLADHTVRAVGSNQYGQLGNASWTGSSTPVTVSGLSDVKEISGGWWHAGALKTDGSVWTWGYNFDGQVGDGNGGHRWTPSRATSNTGFVVGETFGEGTFHTIAADTSGVVWTWGYNGYGMIGDGTTFNRFSPVAISGPGYAWKMPTVAFSPAPATYTAAQNVSLTLSAPVPGTTIRYTTDGTMPTATSTAYTGPINVAHTAMIIAGGFADGWMPTPSSATYTMNFGTLAAPSSSPAAGTFTSSVTVLLSAAQPGATIRYTTNGSDPTASSLVYTAPLVFETTTTLKARAFHPDYTMSAVTTAAYTIQVPPPTVTPISGTYAAGQTITIGSTTPGVEIHYTLDGVDPTQNDPLIASGASLVMGSFTIKARAWKTGTTSSAIASATYSVTGDVSPRALAAGWAHTVALRQDGTAWSWGNNQYKQLGTGGTTPRLSPGLVAGLSGGQRLAGGGAHNFVVLPDGTVRAWGENVDGRLGNGNNTQQGLPVSVQSLSTATAVAAISNHSIALKSDGTVSTWGDNGKGQLGDNTNVGKNVPVAVPGLSSVTAIAQGVQTSFAVKSDGTLWAWGWNQFGQLGDGSQSDRWTPTAVSTLSNVVAARGGYYSAVALMADGQVWTWGNNWYGQLGDGTTSNWPRLTPAVVSGVTGITQIASGLHHVLALKGDGTVWAWGLNDNGQAGNGSTTWQLVPAQIAGLSNIVSVAAGEYHSIAMAADGSVWTWGWNGHGQLGDGTTTDRWSPFLIAGPAMAWRVGPPTLSVAGGQYLTPQTVVVGCPDAYAPTTVHYTTTGVDPIDSDPTVACGGSIAIPASLTLKVSGWRTGSPTSIVRSATYELKVVAPTLSPNTGQYTSPQTITLASTTPGVTFVYTLDGSEPTASSTSTSSTLSISGPATVKARAVKVGWTMSDTGYATYWMAAGAVAAPTFAESPHTGSTERLITIASTTPGATIRYTLDGTDPNERSTIYRYPIRLQASATLKARAFVATYVPSTVATAIYTLDAPGATVVPSLSLWGGTFTTVQSVIVAGPAGATLRYTTTGVDPVDTDTVIASGASLAIDKSLVLKVRAWQAGSTPSAVRRADFIITGALAAGEAFSMALKADGTLWTWGDNYFGQLGDGLSANRGTPVQILSDVIAIAAGMRHALALKRDGTVMGWGENYRGEVGDGTYGFPRRSPTPVTGLTNVVAIAAGWAHSFALKADGTVWAWGHNPDGRLGDGTQNMRTTPVQVVGLAGITAIASRDSGGLALMSGGSEAGSLWVWGTNGASQLGDGSTVDRWTPVRVPNLPEIAQISAGFSWTFAQATTGEVWVWGTNASGQLGLGHTANVSSPVRATLLATPLRVNAGFGSQSFAVERGGLSWVWGEGTDGQLGRGFGDSLEPQLATVPRAWFAAPGSGHTLVADASGQVWSTGVNASGQLGNGTTSWSPSPTFAQVSSVLLVDNSWLTSDPDGDHLSTWREYLLGTDPLNADTNGDGIPDDVQADSGTPGTQPDADNDGVPNWMEQQRGTDPFNIDTDGDGVNDGVDAFPLDPTRWQPLTPTPGDTTPPTITLTEPTTARPVP